MALSEEHTTHEYQRITIYVKNPTGIRGQYKKEYRWKCADPDCSAMFKRFQVRGKRSVCRSCHKNTLILDNNALKQTNPKCKLCSQSKVAITQREMNDSTKDFLDNLLNPPEDNLLSNVLKED